MINPEIPQNTSDQTPDSTDQTEPANLNEPINVKPPGSKIIVILILTAVAVISFGFILRYGYKKPSGQNNISQNLIPTIILPSASQPVARTFTNIKQTLLVREPVALNIEKPYFLMASHLSHDKKQIVYAVIDESIFVHQGRRSAIYKIFIKDLVTDTVTEIYSQDVMGGIIVDLPIAWSISDKYILMRWVNPTDMGRGGAPEYLTYYLNPDDKVISPLAKTDIFINDYESVIYQDNNPDYPQRCGGTMANTGEPLISNNSMIVLQNIETGDKKILVTEKYKYYSGIIYDANTKKINYTVYPLNPAKNEELFSDSKTYYCSLINNDSSETGSYDLSAYIKGNN